MDKSFISEINDIREETINSHYKNAIEEIRTKASKNPLKTEFVVFEADPIERDIANEVAKRLTESNRCETRINGWFFSSLTTVSVTVPLKTTKVEETKVEETKVEETKVEETKVEETKVEAI